MRIPRTMPFLFFGLVLGCGRHPSSSPLPASPSAVPSPPRPPFYASLSGYVYDTAFRHASRATVSLLDGAQAGASTQSNESGRFFFAGTFEDRTTLRVSKDGYAAATGMATANNSAAGTIWAFVQLDELAKPVDITGEYALTIVADSACADMPSDVRTRTYAASIASLLIHALSQGQL